ncbi:MAG TPA: 50S ribosomal protein L10 [Alphaproteobacteria bacterium]|nr:50S ribosomal protein L10 [Alphaproteobacteria bacterium]
MTATAKAKVPHEPLSQNQRVKEARVVKIADDIKGTELVVVVNQLGLDAGETLDLRRKLRTAGVGYKVGKNRLIRHAIRGTRIEALEKFLKGPTALAYSKDPVAAAKATAEFAKKNNKIKLIASVMGDKFLDEAQTKALAALPSLDELRGKIVGLLVAPATKIAGVLQAPAGQLARVIAAKGRG